MSDARAQHNSEMRFFKKAQTYYASALDDCGDIKQSLSHLKKKLEQAKTKVPADKWTRLEGALRSGEITRGKRSTPGDWAAAELRLLRAPR
jgi:hypothetical protein